MRTVAVALGLAGVVAVAVAVTLAHDSSGPAARTRHRTVAAQPTAPAAHRMPPAVAAGRLLRRTIPGARSGFTARPAYVWLPPAATRAHPAPLPVLMLLHGIPGGPADWVRKGRLAAVLDRFAAAHGGKAPIVVAPDINGAPPIDTECSTRSTGDVESYLVHDVPSWVRAHFPAAPPGPRWAVAGLSEGGTCSLLLALRHPSAFGAVGDVSGLARPTVGAVDDPVATIAQLFGGSIPAFDRHDPLWLLGRGRYPTTRLFLACGARDRAVRRDQQRVAEAARRAGITARVTLYAGGHSWRVWRAALRALVPWVWSRVAG